MAIKKGVYKHYKGNLYEVIDIAPHSETEEEHVVYRTLYGDHSLWVRPPSMLDEDIERDDKTIKRFGFVEES